MTVESGVYQHHKGVFYLVLFTAQDSNNTADHEDVVVYYSLDRKRYRVRRAAEFTELVTWPDGVLAPRFVRFPVEP